MKKLVLLLSLFLSPCLVNAATYYISPSGNDISGDGSTGNRWLTFSKAFTSMSGGDTLVVGDGVYTGVINMWSQTNLPPAGSSTSWTTVRGENKSKAIIDGEYVRAPVSIQFTNFTSNPLYLDIDGLTFRNSIGDVAVFTSVQYVKLRNSIGIDAGNGNAGVFTFSRGCSYVLMENCIAFGAGRGLFSVYQSSKSIVRSCVGRIDRVDCGDPLQAIAMYSVDDCVVQNCIIIDSDQQQQYFNRNNDYAGSVVIPCTDRDSNRVGFDSCLSLNNCIGGLSISGKDAYQSKNCYLRNSIWCDITQNNGSSLYTLMGNSSTVTNCTFAMGYSSGAFFVSSDEGFGYNTVLKNNVIFDQRQLNSTPDTYLLARIDTANYNALYGYNLPSSVFTNGSGSVGNLGANDLTTTDPLYRSTNTTGGLKYLPRIESGSNLSGVGESGADIGANAVLLIGTPGTLYGDTGYNSTSTVSMWPFPNEALVKHVMRQYSYSNTTGTITGNRGFAETNVQLAANKARTLSSYVWEYLGSTKPTTVYKTTSTVTASQTTFFTGSTVTLACALSSGTASEYYWDFGDSSYTVTTTSYTTHFYTSTGAYNISAAADSSAGATDPIITSVTVTTTQTFYISPSGSDTSGEGSYDNPWATLQKGMSSMGGGNVLICKNGTYTGALNQIDYYNFPATGSASAWTIIKAETDNKVIFDGEYTRAMFNCALIGDNDIHDARDAYNNPVYWQFEGIIWQNSNSNGGGGPFVQRRRFIKWLRCGNIDAGDGACAAFNVNRCADVLYERCWTMGNGRYQFILYCSSSSIVRQCIARSDRVNPNEIYAIYSMYSAINCEVQNCIAIDSDQHEHYINVDGYSGSFCNPSTDHDGDNINWNSCLALNNNVGGITCSGNNELDACNVTFNNCVLWDINNYWTTNNYIRGQNDVIDHCTFGVFHSTGGQFSFNSYDSSTDTNATMKNTIIYSHTGMLAKAYPGLIYDVEHLDYLSLWLNDTNYSDAPIGTNSITTHNPIWSVTNSSGALKYIVKTEPGSYLGSAGESGSAIGGNCLYMVGELGTMYGEPGYNSTTTIPMWPFPNEAFYKYKMRQYYYVDTVGPVSGNRGFCAAAAQVDTDKARTLTSYVWEYLGNAKPGDLYKTTSTVTSNASSVLVGTTVTFNCALSSGTADVYYWDFGDNSYEVTYTPEATHSYSTDGIYKVSVAADTTAGATDPVYMSMTVGAAIQEGTNAVVGGCSVGNCIWR